MNTRGPVISSPGLNIRTDGLEALAAAARGTLFTVTGTGSQLFSHIEAELSGYYLLGVESDPIDRDGKPHTIRIDVQRRGAIVRTRRQLLNVPSDLNRPRTPRDTVTAGLSAPLADVGVAAQSRDVLVTRTRRGQGSTADAARHWHRLYRATARSHRVRHQRQGRSRVGESNPRCDSVASDGGGSERTSVRWLRQPPPGRLHVEICGGSRRSRRYGGAPGTCHLGRFR